MRAQTTLDFVTGIVVFVLAVGAVFALVPSLVGPATGQDVSEAVVVDRAADELARDILAEPGRPYVLDGAAVAAFFDDSPATVRDRLAIDDRVHVNVVLTNATDTRSVGPTPPDSTNSVYTARRVVTVGDTNGDLRVRVW